MNGNGFVYHRGCAASLHAGTRVRGGNIGTSKGVVELLELVAILLFWFFDTPSKV